jgi:hypothetical protein
MRIVPDRDDSEHEVMTSLPRSRPVRRSAKRGELATTRDAKPAAAKHATARAKAAKPKGAAKPKDAKGKGKAKAAKGKAKPKATSNGSGPREPRRTPRPKPAVGEPRTTPRPRPAAAEARSAVAAAQAPPGEPAAGGPPPPPPPPKRKVPAAGYAAASPRDDETENAVADLVTTTVQAAHELAQIGIDVGRAAMRSMLDRLPRG